MSVSRTAGEIGPLIQGDSWASRLRSALRRVSLCDLLVVALLGCWLGTRLDLVVNHGLVGGSGDESHRLVISYRLYQNFFAYIYTYFFYNPWPPLPYIIQGATFRIQQGLGLTADFGTAAVSSSVCAYVLAIAMTYAAIALRFTRLAGVFATVLLAALHEMTTLAVTPMAESYCAMFLALAFLLAAWPRTSRGNAAFIGLAAMLAAQCRSEMLVLGVAFGAYCFWRRGWLAGAACASIAVFPMLVKTIVNRATGFSGMSYFNLANYYRFEKTWNGNALKGLNALQNYAYGELPFGRLAACSLLAALSAAILYRLFKRRLFVDEQGFRSDYFWLLVGAAGTLPAAILLAMTAGFVLPFPRYFVICHFLLAPPLAVAAAVPLARLSELYRDRAELWKGYPRPIARWLAVPASLACVAVMAGCFYRGAENFRTDAVSQYQSQRDRIPQPILSARAWLRENCHHGNICFDSLLWWETFLFFHNLRSEGELPQFMIYDRPPGAWQEGLQAKPGELYVAITQRYVETFRPEIVVLAGPQYWGMLEGIEKFADLNEKPSYLRPFIEKRENGELEMKNVPYWKEETSLSVRLVPAFENEAVAIYRASYADNASADSRSAHDNPKR